MKINITFSIKSVASCIALVFAVATSIQADTITVTNTNDSGPGSLRQALTDANDGDTIDFAVSGDIGLTTGELVVDKNITISGPGADNLSVDGNATNRVFHISSGQTVTISGLTITGGNASPYGGGIYNQSSTVTLSSCLISSNTADNGGGGIGNDGSNGSATAIINDTILVNNMVLIGGGGAISNDAGAGSVMLEVNGSTISDNSALIGAGIRNVASDSSATVAISNSSLSGNAAGIGNGGGVSNQGANASMQISNSTFSDNSAFGGGTIHNTGNAIIELSDNILKAGKAGGNILNESGSTVTSHGYNLSSDDGGGYLTGPGDHINTDPTLGPLQDNGGPTFTYALLPGSPAIDAGDPNFTPPPLYDQRGPGFDRVVNGRIDIGSFEVQSGGPTPTPTPTASPRVTPRPRPTPHARPTAP